MSERLIAAAREARGERVKWVENPVMALVRRAGGAAVSAAPTQPGTDARSVNDSSRRISRP